MSSSTGYSGAGWTGWSAAWTGISAAESGAAAVTDSVTTGTCQASVIAKYPSLDKKCLSTATDGQSAESPLCRLYLSSKWESAAIKCMERQCGQVDILLIVYTILVCGIAGGVLLWAINGGSFERVDSDRALGKSGHGSGLNNIQTNDNAGRGEGQGGVSEANCVQQVDFTDGLEDGDEGVLAQVVLAYLMHRSLQRNQILPELYRRRLASFCIGFAFFKKLALKLVLFVPLILSGNLIPAGLFIIDIFVLVYFAWYSKYCPGSLYNELHVLFTGKKFVKVPLLSLI